MWVCEQAIWARLSDGSSFDFFPFSHRTPRYYVLSARLSFEWIYIETTLKESIEYKMKRGWRDFLMIGSKYLEFELMLV